MKNLFGVTRVILQAVCVFSISISGGATLAQIADGDRMPGLRLLPPEPETGLAGLPIPRCPQIAKVCALIADPAVRDYVGLSEYAWDFNAPNAVVGRKFARFSTSELRLLESGRR